jgi:hypothetical protein
LDDLIHSKKTKESGKISARPSAPGPRPTVRRAILAGLGDGG